MKLTIVIFCASLLFGTSYQYALKKVPKPDDLAGMARYIVHNVDWMALSTISTINSIQGYPFVNLKSTSDGEKGESTGHIYILMTDLDLSGRDVLVNNKVSVLGTLAEIGYCQSVNYDPQDPRCGRVLITGRLVKVDPTAETYKYAIKSLTQRHPSMILWLKVHKFYVATIDIENILVLDQFGGAGKVEIEDYYKASGNYSSPIDVTYVKKQNESYM